MERECEYKTNLCDSLISNVIGDLREKCYSIPEGLKDDFNRMCGKGCHIYRMISDGEEMADGFSKLVYGGVSEILLPLMDEAFHARYGEKIKLKETSEGLLKMLKPLIRGAFADRYMKEARKTLVESIEKKLTK